MADIVTSYFSAYKAMDYAAMSALMHPDFTFTDPPFGALDGKDSHSMFRMFTTNAPKSHLTITIASPPAPIAGNEQAFAVSYHCDYLFAPGRQVHNEITSLVTVRDGKIYSQEDSCDMVKWAPQALGPVVGTVMNYLPGSGYLVSGMAKKKLAAWVESHPEV